MTEYRPDASPPGLYAKRSFNLGDTILDEAPIIVFRPSPDEEGAVTAQLRTISSDGTASPAAPSRSSRKNRAKGKKSRAAAVKFAPSMDDIPPPWTRSSVRWKISRDGDGGSDVRGRCRGLTNE